VILKNSPQLQLVGRNVKVFGLTIGSVFPQRYYQFKTRVSPNHNIKQQGHEVTYQNKLAKGFTSDFKK